MNKYLLFLFLFFPSPVFAHQNATYPSEIESILKKAGKNRVELEKAISYFKKKGDPLMLKAVYFLISNMDIHFSADYYWADKAGRRIPYDELGFPNYAASQAALTSIISKTSGIHTVSTLIPDYETVKSDFLISNVNSAFSEWKNSAGKKIAFKNFCEYILPYRVSVEPLQSWRPRFELKYLGLKDSEGDLYKFIEALTIDSRRWFASTYGITDRREPLPRLGALQLLFRKAGLCQDMADLQVFALRSQGIPASLNIIPFWATSTGTHFVNTVFDEDMKPIQLDVARQSPKINQSLSSEPSKVIRTTFGKQSGTLATLIASQNIPEGFMRTPNYIDITDEYWPTQTVKCNLFTATQKVTGIAYASVFNGMKWRPTWWGRITNGEVTFSKMSKGVVYLPTIYQNGKTKPIGYPVAIGYHHEQVLSPDLSKRKAVIIKQDAKYLSFRPFKRYKLYYWDSDWRLLAEQKTGVVTQEMLFANVPENALLLLVPEYSQKKERPFIITENGDRKWF